jgi:hypothetical protein
MKIRVLILILLLPGMTVKSQLIKKPVIIETKFHTGLNLPIYEAVNYLIQDDIYSFDLSLSFPTYGRDFWEKLYNYPRTGVGYSFWSLGNNEVLGKANALYGFLSIPFLKRSEKISFSSQVSAGGVYLTRIFDVYNNHLNRASGSHLNIYFHFGIDGKIRLFPCSEIVIEAGITHFSNGKTRSPNYGINEGSVSLGLNYFFNKGTTNGMEPEIPVIGKRYTHSLIYSAGSKVYDNLSGKKYFISSMTYNLDRNLNHRRKIGIGADFFYDGSISEALAGEDGIPEEDFTKLIRFGLHTSYAIRYKELMMGIQVGNYLYSKYTVITRVYSRISLQYLFSDNIVGTMAIKSHMGKADCLEWGIGYTW